MTDQDVRGILERLVAEERLPAFDAQPLLRRARRRLLRNVAGGAIVVAAVVGVVVGGVSMLRTASPSRLPAAPTGPGATLTPFRVGDEVLQRVCCSGALAAVDPATGATRPLVDGEVGEAAWSPDGTRLAYEIPCSIGGGGANPVPPPCGDTASRPAGLYVMDAGLEPTLVASFFESGRFYLPYERHFAWSPDGSALAFFLLGEGLFVARADGSDPKLLAPIEQNTGPPSWAPDGTAIAFAADGAVSVVPSGGGEVTRVSDEGQAPAWSPDGTLIAFSRRDGIGVVRPDGTEPIQVGDGYEFAWSPTGDRLVYHAEERVDDGFLEELWVVAADGSNPTAVVRSECCAGIVDGTLTWSNDGDDIAFLLSEPDGSWRIVAGDGSEAGRPLEQLRGIDLARVLAWQPCRCTLGQ